MSANSPVSYSDLFNFSDRDEILQTIADLRDLRRSYKEFKDEIIAPASAKFVAEMASLSKEIQGVAAASRDLNVTNEKSQASLAANLRVIEQLRNENMKLRQSTEGARQAEEGLGLTISNLTTKLAEQVKAFRNVNYTTAEGEAEALKYGAAIRTTKEEINRMNAATKTTNTTFNAAKASYNELDAVTKQLVKDFKNLTDVEGANKVQAAALSNEIYKNTAKLKEMDQTINQNFRNVGNYKSAFNGLGNAINQLSREAPAFAVSIQTGFLALSNNLPILSDQIQQLTAKNKQLRSEGQPTQSVFKQIAGAVFSWQTALSTAITLTVVFGKQIGEFLSRVFQSKSALNSAAAQAKAYASAIREINQETIKGSAGDVSKIDLLRKIITDVTKSTRERTAAAKEFNAIADDSNKIDLNNLDNLNLINDSISRQIDLIKKRALTRAAENIIAKRGEELLLAQESAKESAEKRQQNIDRVDAATNATLTKGAAKPKTFTNFQGQTVTVQDQGFNDNNNKAGQEVTAIKRRNSVDREIARDSDVIKKQRDFDAANAGFTDLLKGNFTNSQASENKQNSADKKAKADADKAERELEKALKKQDAMIQASVNLQISLRKAQYADTAQTAEDEISLVRDVLKIQETGFSQRLKLFKKDSEAYEKIKKEQTDAETFAQAKITQITDKGIQDRVKNQLKEIKATYDKSRGQFSDEVKAESAKLAVLTKGYDERAALYQKDSDEYKAIIADKAAAEGAYTARILEIEKARAEGRKAIAFGETSLSDTRKTQGTRVDVATKKITAEEGEDIETKRRKDALEAQIADRLAARAEMKEGDQDYLNYTLQVQQLEKDLATEEADEKIRQAERVTEKKKELEQAAFDFAVTTAGLLFDFGRQLNDQKVEDLNHQKDAELALAGSNATARAAIEEKYQKKLLDLKRKQAVYDKLQSIFDIAVNTAVGVTAALRNPATAGFMIPFIIATGALQAAAVIAKPLPKYFKGKKKGEGGSGWAEINEQGTELIEKNGRYRLANAGKKGVAWVDRDDTVHTASETRRIMQNVSEDADSDKFISSLLRGTGVVLKNEYVREERLAAMIASKQITGEQIRAGMASALKDLPMTMHNYDEQGYSKYMTRKNQRTEDVNARNQMGGSK